MGLLKNTETLQKLEQYLTHTNFGNQSIGHNLTLGFLPTKLGNAIIDKRYTFALKHRLLKETNTFTKATFSEIIVKLIIKLTEEITTLPKETVAIYEQVGLIEDNKCTKELISTVLANAMALNPSFQVGNTTTVLKYSDNLQNIFTEFGPKNIEYFLTKLDNYKPTF